MNNKSLITIIIEALIFIGIIMFGISYYNKKIDTYDQNIKAFKGSIEQLELKNGELISTRDSYILKIKDLEEYIGVTEKEVKDLKKKLGSSLAYISRLESNIKVDTIVTIKDTIIYKDRETDIRFNYKDQWISFTGQTLFDNKTSNTKLFDLNVYSPLTVGLTDDYQIFVKSPNPYLHFTDIEGAVIDGSKLKPKKTRFNWGFQLGFGVSYDIFEQNYSIGTYGGIGVEVNF